MASLKICSGPNNSILMHALFDRAQGNRPVSFTVINENDQELELKVVITAIEWEGGLDCWIFKGFHSGNTQVNGYYECRTGHGWIEETK